MSHYRLPLVFRRTLSRALQFGLLIAMLAGSTGCSVIERFLPGQDVQTPAPPVTAVEPLPATPVQSPPEAPPAVPSPMPTYTPLPTYTLAPTFTPLPTYTLPPTFTPVPVYIQPTPIPPSPAPNSGACCTLRVRNRGKTTFWIGATLPYGGNYIKPRQYVEFYLPGATWLRVYWCKYRWAKDNKWYDDDFWNENLYSCQHIDVYTDVPLKEIGVR